MISFKNSMHKNTIDSWLFEPRLEKRSGSNSRQIELSEGNL